MTTMIKTIYPYWTGFAWAFDDADVGLEAEPLVSGSSEVVTALMDLKGIPGDKLALTFSDTSFDGFDIVANWIEADEYGVGNWYQADVNGETMVGWLCPALLKYFDSPPKTLFVRAHERT